MKQFISFIDNLTSKHTPDPLAIALFLSLLVYAFSAIYTGSFSQPLTAWEGGFWTLLKFTMQMAMILLGGFLVASSPLIRKVLHGLASQVKSPRQALIVVTLISCLTSWLNWGLGLVVSAVLALELGKSVKGVNYRVLVAAAYSGFILWHGGLSGSIPLLLNSDNHFSFDLIGRVIPLQETLFSQLNLTLVFGLGLLLLISNYLLNHFSDNPETHLQEILKETHKVETNNPEQLLNKSSKLFYAIGLFGFAALLFRVFGEGFKVNLDSINYILLFSALVLHKNINSFLQALNEGVQKVGPILIQYPFYAGIMAMLIESELAALISQFFVNISTVNTLPFFTFLSAGFVNLMIPSGGGQWAVQGPIVIPAVNELGADMSKTIMAVAWGDAWTNLLQPFWALPLLAIANLKIKDIMGFCIINLLVSGVFIALVLLV
jgi:short-chain fatty acids transporter